MAYTDQQIAEYAKKLEASGASPEKIREFVTKAKAEQNPTKEDPGFIQSVAQGVARLPLKIGTSLAGAGIAAAGLVGSGAQALMGNEEASAREARQAVEASDKLKREGVDFGYFGNVKPMGASTPVGESIGVGEAAKEFIGMGAEAASYAIGGPTAKTTFNILKAGAPAISTLLKSVIAPGAAASGLGVGGASLQDESMSIPEVALSTAIAAPIGAGLALTGLGGSAAVRGVKSKLFPNLEKEAMDAVTSAIQRGIQPPVRKVKTAAESEKYYSQASEAFSDIASRRGTLNLTNEFGEEAGELPSSVSQLTQAIEQAKKAVFEGYDTLNRLAGTSGRELPTAPIVRELRELAQDEKLLRYNPSAAKYAARLASDLERRGSFNLQDAQDEVQFLNEGLKRLYGARDVSSTNKIWVDKFLADRLRAGLDAVIDAETGQSYQGLRNMYRNYKTIEDDANHRAAVLLRGASKGLPDFLNIQSVGDVVVGLASGQPAFVASGVAQKALNSYYKYLNSPNQAIVNAFKALTKTTGKAIKEDEAIKKGIQVKMQKKPPLALPEPRYIPAPPTGGYSGGAIVSQGGGAAPITQMSQNEVKRSLAKTGTPAPAPMNTKLETLGKDVEGALKLIPKEIQKMKENKAKAILVRVKKVLEGTKKPAAPTQNKQTTISDKKKKALDEIVSSQENKRPVKKTNSSREAMFNEAIRNMPEYRKEGIITDKIRNATIMQGKTAGAKGVGRDIWKIATTNEEKQALAAKGYSSAGSVDSFAKDLGYEDMNNFSSELEKGLMTPERKEAMYARMADEMREIELARWDEMSGNAPKKTVNPSEIVKKYLSPDIDDIPFGVGTIAIPKEDENGDIYFEFDPRLFALGLIAGKVSARSFKTSKNPAAVSQLKETYSNVDAQKRKLLKQGLSENSPQLKWIIKNLSHLQDQISESIKVKKPR